jgi:hypothetical protein
LGMSDMGEWFIHREFLGVVRSGTFVSFGFQQPTPCTAFDLVAMIQPYAVNLRS